jgi:hypothetical protein
VKRITARIAVLAAGLAVPAAVATSALADSGPGGGQAAAQLNKTGQVAANDCQSKQLAPSYNNENADNSPSSGNGQVTQSPSSTVNCVAANKNSTDQDTSQKMKDPSQDPSQAQDPSQDPSQAQDPSHGHGQFGLQANSTDQTAANKCKSDQFAPSYNNENANDSQNSDNGSVTQNPSSTVNCVAANSNKTDQDIKQQKGQPEQQDPSNG